MLVNEITTISEAQQKLRDNWHDGINCLVCGQRVQLYNYKLFASSAFALIDLYKLDANSDDTYFHVKEFAEARAGKPRSSHFAELRFWGFVEPKPHDIDNKRSSGYWRITDEGKRFVLGGKKVQSRILVYNNKFQGFAENSEMIDIYQALNNEFDYQELMNGM